jgi:KipI family sensor histidine kinase inhibitor
MRAIEAAGLPGIQNLTPGLSSLLVEFDPLAAEADALSEFLQKLDASAAMDSGGSGRRRRVPVVYGGEHGPDLEDVAARLGLQPGQVIQQHTQAEHVVQLIGFAPGFPYIGGLPAALALPRRESPRERVPVGSVAIAGRQTGIYPTSTPGGWHLVGRTPIVLFDAERQPPAYFAPGDRVRFVPIAESDWSAYAGPAADW